MSKKHKRTHATTTKSSRAKPRPTQKRAPIWVWIVFAAGFIGAGIYWLGGSKSLPEAEITIVQAQEKIQQGGLILDVRTKAEYDSAHIANSTLISLSDLKNRVGELPRDREIVVVCRSGNRSKLALSVLQNAGFAKAYSMAGGVNAWRRAGYPLEGVSP